MELSSAITLCREALGLAIQLAAPTLLILLAVGLLVGIFQTATQIQEQTLPMVLKLIAGALVLAWFLPWMTGRLVEYTRILFEKIPENLGQML